MINSLNKYILPTPSWLRGEFTSLNRLYAYPTEPEISKKGLIILDSGAFGLSKAGRKMDVFYMKDLHDYYSTYNHLQNVVCIAPDEFLNPYQTMQNWKYWNSKGYCKVSPVIQCKEEKKISPFEVLKQVQFYKGFNIDFIAFSNPSLRSKEVKSNDLKFAIQTLRDAFPQAWMHNLGAGWNANDIKGWFQYDFDSIDSIAYYTDAEQSKKWRLHSNQTFLDESLSKTQIALTNVEIAQLSANLKF